MYQLWFLYRSLRTTGYTSNSQQLGGLNVYLYTSECNAMLSIFYFKNNDINVLQNVINIVPSKISNLRTV